MAAKLTLSSLKILVNGVLGNCTEHIGCDECWDQIDRFAEIELEGKDAAEILPLVEDHLERCGHCHEEFEALLAALKNLPPE
jgi:hypothetical protein